MEIILGDDAGQCSYGSFLTGDTKKGAPEK
jgi:hypothetical protein